MRPTVAASLQEREVVGVLNGGRLGKPPDRLGQEVGEVGYLDAGRDLGLGPRMFRRALGVDDRVFVLNLLPLEALLAAISVEAFAILSGHVEQGAGDLGGDVAVFDGECGGFHGERAAVTADQVFSNAARPVANNVLGVFAEDGKTRAHAVGGVPHRRQPGPVIGPAVHILLVAAPQKLKAAQLALVIQVFDEQVFPAVNDRLHHHVDLAARSLGFDNLTAFVDRRAHRYRAGDVLPGLQCLERHPGVVGDRRVDMDGVDVRVIEELTIVGKAGLDAITIAALVEFFAVAPADRIDDGTRVLLIDRDKLGTETQADDCHADRLFARHRS
jgi:hypothetical protein